MILATSKRSTNIRAQDAVSLIRLINRKAFRRPWGNRKSHTLQDYRIAAELGITESRVKNAKKLLSSLNIIDFGGTVFNKKTNYFVKLWNISVRYSRYAFVWNPEGEVITESRQGKRINEADLRFKLISKSHVRLSEARLDSDTHYDNDYPWLHIAQEKAEQDRLLGIKKLSKIVARKAKKVTNELFDSIFDIEDIEFAF